MANRVLSLVQKMFNFALDREWIDANPAARLKPVSPETRRDRVLSADEIRTLWRELNAEHHRIATMFRTQLLTAQRPGEVSRMRWARRRSFDEGRRIVEGGREASLMVGTRDAVPGRSQR
jgi:integrase